MSSKGALKTYTKYLHATLVRVCVVRQSSSERQPLDHFAEVASRGGKGKIALNNELILEARRAAGQRHALPRSDLSISWADDKRFYRFAERKRTHTFSA